MPNRNPSLAVLIDAENVSARQVKAIHDTIETHGNPVLWRTYGSFTRLGMAAWNKYINENPSEASRTKPTRPAARRSRRDA